MDADELLARQLQVYTFFFYPSKVLNQCHASGLLGMDIIDSPKCRRRPKRIAV